MEKIKQIKQQGFTLIELLIVIAVLAILATVAFVGIDPLSRFQDARNAKRSTDVNQILSAIKLYQVDHKGSLPDVFGQRFVGEGEFTMIGKAAGDCAITCANPTFTTQGFCIDLTALVTGGYLPSVPIDSSGDWSDQKTGYYLENKTNKTFTIGTCQEEQGSAAATPDISATR